MAEKPIMRVIAKDWEKDREGSWSWFAVIHFTGQLQMREDMPETVSDEQMADVIKLLEEYGVCVQSAGNGGPGARFANEPWFQWYPSHIIVSQNGGLDI